MSDKEQQIWHAKRLITLAAKSTAHTARRIRAGLPARAALARTDRLIRISNAAWLKAVA